MKQVIDRTELLRRLASATPPTLVEALPEKYYRDGQLNFKQWLASHRGVDEKAVFAMDDPIPAFWMGIRDLGMLWKQKTGKKAGSGLL